jgi:hypothetical protein
MLTDVNVTGSDDWRLIRLAVKLGQGFQRLALLRSFSNGTRFVPAGVEGVNAQAMLRIVKEARLNTAELIAGSLVDRQTVLGFRTAAPGDDTGDSVAQTNWKRSNMAVRSKELLRDVADYGEAFVLTTGPTSPAADAKPMFLTLNGWTCATEQFPTTPWLTEDAIVTGYDVINRADVITLFRPGYMRIAYRPSPVPTIPNDGTPWSPGSGWSWATDPTPLGYTADNPIVQHQAPGGYGEFEKHTDTIDRINSVTRDRMTIIAMQAFRQRAIEGSLPTHYPSDYPDLTLRGQRIDYNEVFAGGPAALWLLGGDAKIWESSPTDITQLITAAKDDKRDLAAVSATPIYLLMPDATSGSAEGAQLAREAFSFKVRDRNNRAAQSWALEQSIAFQALGDTVRSDATQIETIYAAVDLESMQARATSGQAAKASGVSQAYINRAVFQMTPQELAQEEQDKADEAFADAVAASTSTKSTTGAAA